MRKNSFFLVLTIVLCAFLFISGCANQKQKHESEVNKSPAKQTDFLLGTVVTVKVYDKGKDEVLDKVFNRIKALDEKIADTDGSEINQINDKAGIEPVKVSGDIYRLVEAGKSYSANANGSFDISVGPLTSLWRIGFDDARKPGESEIEEVLPLIDYKQVKLNNEEQTIYLQQNGMKLDLGAIAKGFIADEVIKVLKEEDVTTAIIDLGGNIYVLGNNPTTESPWTVGIQNPFLDRGEIVGKLKESNKSIVTSGIYERYLEVDGVKYHHILNPKDGYPYFNEIAGVSIISDQSIDGDALSTILFSKGIEGGLEYINNIEDAEAIFISMDQHVYLTDGLNQAFELTNNEFKLKQF
ncbi:FAD:protein FMN transferase [Aquibacillus sediminis]|uniref:FAD:protein FMN transferase n=1 Tax=Aquibacillus sediminis TaxID=2574734 RepID=UPI0011092DC9|nr:FAD:protein FMN transferase [Aquibacillus sediminis]